MKCIIPAAGYGTRMGMKPNQSKEMIKYQGKPMIQWSLDLCKMFDIEPLVITRKEKKDLRQYLFNAGIKFIDIEVEGEWNDTVLKSREYWDFDNLLLLPDTRFDTLRCIKEIKQGLKLGNNAVMALHLVTDPTKWGIVENYKLYEKNKNFCGAFLAWGVIGFKNTYGQELFSKVECLELDNVGFTYLNKFKDLTRGDKK